MSTEIRLIEVLNNNWKGFQEYSDYTKDEKEEWKKPYSIEELYTLAKEAFNLGVEMALENAEAKLVMEDDPVVGEYENAVVNYESIIKLKI